MTRACSLVDTFRAARTTALGAGALCVGVLLSGCSGSGDDASDDSAEHFSFFVTSMAGLLDLAANDQGFGGDLSYGGKIGVLGADELCATLAERSMKGSSSKGWKAFLSTSSEDAIDRIAGGPWFDRQGRRVADDKEGLVATRPLAADPQIVDDLPNEDGLPNHLDAGPECQADNSCRDNHDILTGSDDKGRLVPGTCEDWTSLTAPGQPMVGHSWPAQSGRGWLRAHLAGGCGRGVKVKQLGAPMPGDRTVGAGGGYGGFYCFASTP
jgi:hypothetical protein